MLVTAAAVHGAAAACSRRPSSSRRPTIWSSRSCTRPSAIHKSGPPFLARYLPFWAATLVDRVKVLILPLLVLVPLARLVPPVYRWRIRSKIIKRTATWSTWTRRSAGAHPRRSATSCWPARPDRGRRARSLRVPLGYADAHYHLRKHVDLVRAKVKELRAAAAVSESRGDAAS